LLTSLLSGSVAGIPIAVIILALLVALWLWARRTRFLLHLISIGSDESAAQMNGVRVGLVKVGAYSLSGLFAALSGLYLAAQTTSGDPNIGAPLMLLSIAAVVIGGVRLSGGRGSLLGVIAGAFIISILGGIMYLAGVSSYYQDLFQGLILLVAVGISSYRGLRNRYMRAYL
jgi:ribose transport system permease protein